MRIFVTIMFALVGLLGGAACGGGNSTDSFGACTSANATATTSVTVADYSYSPACIKVAVGQTVTWTNTGMASHTVTSDVGDPEAFASDAGGLGTNGTYAHTFNTAGTYGYHCIPHLSLGMVGTVIVE